MTAAEALVVAALWLGLFTGFLVLVRRLPTKRHRDQCVRCHRPIAKNTPRALCPPCRA